MQAKSESAQGARCFGEHPRLLSVNASLQLPRPLIDLNSLRRHSYAGPKFLYPVSACVVMVQGCSGYRLEGLLRNSVGTLARSVYAR